MKTSLAIIADYDPQNLSHIATTAAVSHSAAKLNAEVSAEWIHTSELARPGALRQLAGYDGLWVGPGSPYANMDGVLSVIEMARDVEMPLLGTCGGFQHIVVEYARNVLGLRDADHQESAPDASCHVVSRLARSLVGRKMILSFQTGSKLRAIYNRDTAEEQYLCNFGVNPAYAELLCSGRLKLAASDGEGIVRAVELPDHRFFIGTLFLPQLAATRSAPHPLISAFISAAMAAPARRAAV